MWELKAGSTVGGKYYLERELRCGGMGALWVAFDFALRRTVVVKFIQRFAATDRQMRSRFEREGRAAARIRSPNVIEMYDYGVDRGCAFIVMEYLEGEDLSSRLERDTTLPLDQASYLFAQLASALDAMHAVGVIHRDLKPSNVFLVSTDRGALVKVVDFGIAKTPAGAFATITETGMLLGTPKYMSPEQTKKPRDVDHRSDLWSAAVILYRLITGFCPFNGQSTVELVGRICRGAFHPPSTLVDGLPASVDAFFARALARDPGDRFQSGKAMMRAFQIAVGDPTLPAARPTADRSTPEDDAAPEDSDEVKPRTPRIPSAEAALLADLHDQKLAHPVDERATATTRGYATFCGAASQNAMTLVSPRHSLPPAAGHEPPAAATADEDSCEAITRRDGAGRRSEPEDPTRVQARRAFQETQLMATLIQVRPAARAFGLNLGVVHQRPPMGAAVENAPTRLAPQSGRRLPRVALLLAVLLVLSATAVAGSGLAFAALGVL